MATENVGGFPDAFASEIGKKKNYSKILILNGHDLSKTKTKEGWDLPKKKRNFFSLAFERP